MSEQPFDMGAAGLDVERIVGEIRASVDEKIRQGVYNDAAVGRAERRNLVNLKGDEEFVSFYLSCLQDAVFVDINDFEIHERRKYFGHLLRLLKRVIWNLLRFYTYRLWSQQNQVNGLLLTAVQGLDEIYRKKVAELEARVVEVEKRTGTSE